MTLQGRIVKKETLDAALAIAKKDEGNLLLFFDPLSYDNYSDDRSKLSKHIKDNMLNYNQRLNGADTGSSTVFNDIKKDFDSNKDESFDRLIRSVFTKSRSELDELASKCSELDDVSIYIFKG